MVEDVPSQVEWHLNAPSPLIGSTGQDMLNRHIREVGLHSGLAIEVADGSMATKFGLRGTLQSIPQYLRGHRIS